MSNTGTNGKHDQLTIPNTLPVANPSMYPTCYRSPAAWFDFEFLYFLLTPGRKARHHKSYLYLSTCEAADRNDHGVYAQKAHSADTAQRTRLQAGLSQGRLQRLLTQGFCLNVDAHTP